MASSIKYMILAVLIGCHVEDSSSLQEPPKAFARSVDCENIPWNWSNVGQPFMLTWCTSCHHPDLVGSEVRQGAPDAYNFHSYSETVSHAPNIMNRVIDQTPSPMPPAGGPSEKELQRLYEWIDCGMPEN